jgi:hypothetical protein
MVVGDLFNRPACGFVQSGKMREKTTRAAVTYTHLHTDMDD